MAVVFVHIIVFFLLKEFIEFYRSRNTSVLVTFLDASNAYDKSDHWQLFNKLLNIHVPVFIIIILVFWYSRQEMFIMWGNSCSTKFRVTNAWSQTRRYFVPSSL